MPDYMQRSGPPVKKDILLAKKFASKANSLIERKEWNYAIGSINGEVVAKPFDEVTEVLRTQNVHSNWYATSKVSLGTLKNIIV